MTSENNINGFDDMKEMWLELNHRIAHLEEENRRLSREAITSKYKSTGQRLVRRYKSFIILEGLTLLLVVVFLLTCPILVEKYKIACILYWIIFFAGEMAFDIFLLWRVENMDLNGPVSEIAKMAASNWKYQKLGIVLGLPAAIGAAVLYALTLGANFEIIIGMIIGGLIGAFIGVFQLMKFKKDYRYLQTEE